MSKYWFWTEQGQRKSPEQRFWERVNRQSDEECWIWIGPCTRDGYGVMNVNKKQIRVHRFSWEMAHGTFPSEMQVLHQCDEKLCVNPSHLFLGTNWSNLLDMSDKDRSRFGEQATNVKLTREVVEEIRRRYASSEASQISLGKQYGVSQFQISQIVRGKSWLRAGGPIVKKKDWGGCKLYKVTIEEEEEICSRYVPGKVTRRQLAKEYGLSISGIRRILGR